MTQFTDFMAGVLTKDWELVEYGKDADGAARKRIAESLDGVDLYHHAGPPLGDAYTWVTLADLLCHGVIPRVTLHKDE